MHRMISWTAVIIWMAIIFSLSAQAGEQSNRLSTGITEIAVKTAEKVSPGIEVQVPALNRIIRKNAHFFFYMIFGLLAMNAFRRSGYPVKASLLLSFLLCTVYAVSDEIHQLYVPGRGARAADVLIDCSGTAAGLFIYRVVSVFYGKFIRRGKASQMQAGG